MLVTEGVGCIVGSLEGVAVGSLVGAGVGDTLVCRLSLSEGGGFFCLCKSGTVLGCE